jgi:hypothetical protein
MSKRCHACRAPVAIACRITRRLHCDPDGHRIAAVAPIGLPLRCADEISRRILSTTNRKHRCRRCCGNSHRLPHCSAPKQSCRSPGSTKPRLARRARRWSGNSLFGTVAPSRRTRSQKRSTSRSHPVWRALGTDFQRSTGSEARRMPGSLCDRRQHSTSERQARSLDRTTQESTAAAPLSAC